MRKTHLTPKMSADRNCGLLILFVIYILLIAVPGAVKSQTKVLADEVSYSTPGQSRYYDCVIAILCKYGPSADQVTNATRNDNDFATLYANPGAIASLGKYQGVLELKFPQPLNADTWSYVRIQGDNSLLKSLLGGSLGDVLADVLGTVLLGDQEIVIEAKNGTANSVLQRTSTQGFDTDRVRLVEDKNGDFLIAIRPDGQYDRIRITNRSAAVVGLLQEYSLQVYNAFTYGDQDCLQAQSTSFDGEGLSLTLLEGGSGATDLNKAIDDDEDSYSQISTGSVGLGIGNSVYQTIYYDKLSAPEDYLKIKLGVGNGALVNAELIGSVEIKAFNGNTLVYTKKLSSGLINGVDVLGLLQNGEPATIYLGPGKAFDRVTVGYNALVELNLGNSPLYLYDIKRYGPDCPGPDPLPGADPTDPMLIQKDCATNVVSFDHANFPFNTTDGNNDTYTTLEASSGILLGGVIGEAYSGHVEMGFGTAVDAGKTVYVRIDFDEESLGGLLDGSVGDLLGSTLDNALFGEHYFTIEAKNVSGAVLARSSRNGFYKSSGSETGVGDGTVKIVQDKNGHYYVAITSDQSFSSLRITEKLSSLAGLGTVKTMNVYHACTSTGADLCEQAFATYSESNGINLDLLGIGGAGVSNAENALTSDVDTKSEINLGAAGVGASVFQFVEYHTLSAATDHFNLTFSVNAGSLVDLGLLSNIEIRTYAGDAEVFSQKLSEDVIDLDLLSLLQSGQPTMVRIAPGVAFDRIAIGKSALVDANVLSSPLYIHKIERFGADCPDPDLVIPDPTDDPFNTPGCADDLVSFGGTNFVFNAIDGNNETFATLTSGTGTALGIGGYNSHIELGYTAPVDAYTTSYIRINFEEDILKSLLGGTLGNIVGDLLGGVVLGNHYFTVDVNRADGSTIVSGDSRDQFGDQFVKLVQDAEGRYYIAVTAAEDYQSVRITHELNSLVGFGKTATMDVYNMCHETAPEFCDQARFVSYDGSGLSLSLDLTDITEGSIINPHYVIDQNTSNYSTINLGVAGVGANIYQNIYFNGSSKDTDKLRLRVQLNQPGLLNLDLVGSYRVKLYHGGEEVYNEPLQSALLNNVDLLALLNSGGIQELTLEPGVVFDRVQFGQETVLAVNTGAPLRLYEVSRISDGCPDPTFEEPPFVDPLCASELIDAENVENLDNLFNGNHNSYATIKSDAGLVAGIFGYNGHVELGYGVTNVDAGTTSYIRIDTDETLLQTLLGGSLGEALSSIAGSVVLGHHYFELEVKDINGIPVVSGSSSNLFSAADGAIKIVQDAEGRYYLAITPTEDYNRIRITDYTNSIVGLNNENSINVYGMCHETSFEGCAFPFTTSFDGTGLSIDLTDVAGYGVTNAYRAIDANNSSDYSEISLGTLNVAGSVVQKTQFNKALEANTVVKLDMSIGTGVLAADVFGRMEVVGYRYGEEVYTEELENAVIGNVNLAQLFNNGARAEISFAADVEVDEVGLRLRSIASVAAVPNVRLYNVEVDCTVPQFIAWKSFEIDGDPALTSVSGGETVEYTIHIRNTGTVDLTDYIVTDVVPTHTMYVPASGGVFDNGEVTFSGINVAAGATETVSFKVLVDADLTGIDKISNVAVVKLDANDTGTGTVPPADPADPTAPDPGATPGTPTDIPVQAVETVSTWKGFEIAGGVSQTEVQGGETVTYTIYIQNTGNQDLSGLTVSDALPAGTTFQSAANGGALANEVVSFEGIDLPFGQTTSVSFSVLVDTDLTGLSEISNIAYVKQTPTDTGTPTAPADPTDPTVGPDPDSDPGDPTVIPVTDIFNLVLWKSYGVSVDGSTTFDPTITAVSGGEVIEYTVHVRNTGNKTLNNVVVDDPLTGGITLASGYSASHTFVTLAVGETKTHTFRVTVATDLSGISVIHNIAVATSDEITTDEQSHPPLDNTNPTDPDITEIGTVVDVTPIHEVDIELNGVSDGANSGMAAQNDQITYTITVTNTGNKNLEDLTLTGNIPSDTDFVSSMSGGTPNVANTQVAFPAFDLAVGETKTFTYIVVSNVVPPNSVDNEAIVTFEDPEGDPLSRSDTHSMPTDCTPVVAEDLALSASGPICLGEAVTLTAVLSGTSTLDPTVLADVVWYSAYNTTTGVPSGEVGTGATITVRPTVDGATYHAVVVGAEYCFQNPPAAVTVTVNAIPVTPIIAALATDEYCEGDNVILTVSNAEVGMTYAWFKDGIPLAGTGAALVVTETGHYTVQASNAALCTSDGSQGVDIAFHPRPVAVDIQVTGNEAVCEATAVSLQASLIASPSTGAINNPVFRWYSDAALTDEIHVGASLEITPLATTTYYVTVSGDQVCENSVSEAKAVPVTVNPTPDYTVDGDLSYGIEVGNSVTLPIITSAAATITWYDDAGNPVTGTTTRQFDAVGTYTYTAVITQTDHCTVALSVLINVFAEGECPPVFSRVYATGSSFTTSLLLGSVTDANDAVDGDLGTHSTISEGLNIIGLLGQTSQTLKWATPVQAGTPVSVKLAKNFNVASVLGSLRLVAVNATGTAVSTVQNIEPKLVNAVSGLNIYEYTFTPVDNNGQAVAYSGVKVYIAGVVNLIESANIYEAYYHEAGAVDCGAEEVFDVLHGIENPISLLDLASGLIGVSDAENAVDTNPATYATMNNLAAVNAKTRMEVLYNVPALAGDQLVIDLSFPSNLLNVQALQSFTIQPYLGNVPVGPPAINDGIILKIELLGGGSTAQVTYTASQAFDRVKILYGGVADVLGELRVHEISRQVPQLELGDNNDNTFEICEGDDISIPAPDDCTGYIIYNAATGGTVVDITQLAPGTYTLYVQTVRFGTCEVGERTEIEVIVHALPIAPTVTDQELCQEEGVVASYLVTVPAGHVAIYYANADPASLPLVDIPTVDQNIPGTYTVYVSLRNTATGCEGPRVPVIIVVDRTATAADITVSDVTICAGESFTLSATSTTVTNPVFTFYTDAALTSELTDLTVSPSVGDHIYYVTVNGDGVCANQVGDAAMITVTVNRNATAADIIVSDATICAGESLTLSATSTTVTNPVFTFYTDAALTAELTDLTVSPAVGDHIYYVTISGDGVCANQVGDAAMITVTVNRNATAADITVSDATICAGESFTLSATSTTVTNPVFTFYTDAALTSELTDLTVSPAVGDHIYYVTVSGDGVCANGAGDAAMITVTVNRNATAADIIVSDATICLGESLTLSVTSTTVTNPVFRFYTDASLTNELTNLTVSPSTNTIYYVTVSGDGVCANHMGDAATINVIVNITPAPTIGDAAPEYCIHEGKILADLPVIGTGIKWYTTPTGGVALPNTTLLLDGVTYYASQVGDNNCESIARLAVTPIVRDCEVVLSITKQADDSRVIAGGNTSFTLTITNNGPGIVEMGDAITLEDIPSVGLQITGYSVTSGNATVVGTGNSATVTTGAILGVGGSIVMTVTADVDADAPATVSNKILVWGPDTPPGDVPDDEDETPPIPVDREYNLTITKVADQARVKAGESTSFTVTVTNDGPSAIAAGRDLLLGEVPSTGLTITGYSVTSGSATVVGTGNSATVTTGAILGVGGSIVVKITADVDADAPATVSNKILVWGPDTPPGDDPDGEDETPPIPVDREYNLTITKAADQARVKAGESTSFTVTLTNNGPSAISVGRDLVLGEVPSTGLTITGYSVTSGNATVVGTGNSATVTTGAILGVGGSIVVTVTADVDADAPSTVSNKILVWGPDTPPGDDPDGEDETPPIPVDREYNLTITKAADQARVKAGESTSFTVTLTNNGPSAISADRDLVLGELPSTGLTITGYEVTSGNATVVGAGNNATVTTSDLIGIGGAIVVKVTADVDADAPATVSNKILVWGPDTPPGDDPDDEDETPPIPVDRESKLSITKVADEERVKAGEQTTFTITVTNDGPSVIEIGKNISLLERPGEGVTIDSYEMISANATVAGVGNSATLTTTDKIAVNGTIVLKIVATVDDEAPELITNGITVWGPEKDPEDDPEDDKDDPDPIPVDFPLINAIDDFAEVKLGSTVTIDVLDNDIVTKWDKDPATVEITQHPAYGVAEVLPDGKVAFTAPTDRLGDVQFKYTVRDVKGRQSNEATVTVTVLENPLEIPNVITPNDDGFNDKFVIRGLEVYDRAHLTIMNRWGNEVYKNNAYDNEWMGRGLNEGTYFYVLELVRDGKVTKYTGSILIKRN